MKGLLTVCILMINDAGVSVAPRVVIVGVLVHGHRYGIREREGAGDCDLGECVVVEQWYRIRPKSHYFGKCLFFFLYLVVLTGEQLFEPGFSGLGARETKGTQQNVRY